MLILLACALALAQDYSLAEIGLAAQQGVPDSLLASMAGSCPQQATPEEAVRLLRTGVPPEIVSFLCDAPCPTPAQLAAAKEPGPLLIAEDQREVLDEREQAERIEAANKPKSVRMDPDDPWLAEEEALAQERPERRKWPRYALRPGSVVHFSQSGVTGRIHRLPDGPGMLRFYVEATTEDEIPSTFRPEQSIEFSSEYIGSDALGYVYAFVGAAEMQQRIQAHCAYLEDLAFRESFTAVATTLKAHETVIEQEGAAAFARSGAGAVGSTYYAYADAASAVFKQRTESRSTSISVTAYETWSPARQSRYDRLMTAIQASCAERLQVVQEHGLRTGKVGDGESISGLFFVDGPSGFSWRYRYYLECTIHGRRFIFRIN